MGKKIRVNCSVCGKEVVRWKRYNKRVDTHFCNEHLDTFYLSEIKKAQQLSDTKGEKNYNWKGGFSKRPDGYVRIMAEVGNRQLYHRYLIEKNLGTKLRRDQIVHHINGDPSDNRLENLMVITRKEHGGYHKWGRPRQHSK